MATTSYYMLPLTVLVQYLTNLGIIAAGASVQTNVAGSVNTLAATFTDSTGLVANANPLTLNAAGRAANPTSGALVGFWVASGTVVDVYFTDVQGDTWSIKSMSGINDPAGTNSLQVLLASPASSNASGVGPVAGADLVANAVKSYDVIADVRAANAPVLASGQTLTISVQGGAAINDGLGGDFYWNPTSTATDNGASILKPNLTSGAGRWIRLGTPPYGAQASLVSATNCDLGTVGSNFVQITGTNAITSFGSSASLARPLYFLTFAASLSLTYSSSAVSEILLPGGVSITTQPGDMCIAEYLGPGTANPATGLWQVLAYFRATASLAAIVKTAIQSVTSSTVLVNDTQLVTTLAAGATYLAQIRCSLSGTGGTGQGYKLQAYYTGTLSTPGAGGGVYSNNGTAAVIYTFINSSPLGVSAVNATEDFVNLDFVFTTNAAGAFGVQFAQNSSSANATNMLPGSLILLTRLA